MIMIKEGKNRLRKRFFLYELCMRSGMFFPKNWRLPEAWEFFMWVSGESYIELF